MPDPVCVYMYVLYVCSSYMYVCSMCIHMHRIYIHTHTHTYMHGNRSEYPSSRHEICTWMYVCMCICMCICMYVWWMIGMKYVDIIMYACMCYACMCMYVCMYGNRSEYPSNRHEIWTWYVCMCVCLHVYVYTYLTTNKRD